ncbi:MAG TPA: NADPH-dependent FMN reductase [Thermoplasmata archaeon]|nr:NADPH-dependent FMN reductase [Thermoplasmata archaeon]
MPSTVHILGISGSLRTHSTNTGLLRAAAGVLPPDTELEIVTLHGIPPYNQDEELAPVDAVRSFKSKVRAADAILFAVPEYNYSVAGVLKNAIDWASRPPTDNVWPDKPVAMIGASVGMMGTGRAQLHLRQSFVTLNMHPLSQPEVQVTFNSKKFDAQGNLTDSDAREHVRALLVAFVAWTRLLRGEPSAPK